MFGGNHRTNSDPDGVAVCVLWLFDFNADFDANRMTVGFRSPFF